MPQAKRLWHIFMGQFVGLFAIKQGTALGGEFHFVTKFFDLAFGDEVTQFGEIRYEEVHLLDESVLVEHEKFAPHGIVDAGDTS